MELINIEQIHPQKLAEIDFHFFIGASGFEKRCPFLVANFEVKARRFIVLAFREKATDLQRKVNDDFFKERNYEILQFSGEENVSLNKIINPETSVDPSAKEINIIVDYSCMTKKWYASIISELVANEDDKNVYHLFFSYTPAVFRPPAKARSFRLRESLLGNRTANKENGKPVALIIGLGTDKKKAEYIAKNIKHQELVLMYTDPAINKEYVKNLLQNNQDLINSVDIRNFISFPIQNLEKTNRILVNLVLELRLKYKVIIAPMGPKVFTLVSLLIASRYPDVEVKRFSSGGNENVYPKEPASDPIILKTTFSNLDDEM